MAKISPLMILPPVIFAAFAGLAIGGMMRDNPDELPSTFVGNQAPAVPLEAVQGTAQLTDADLRSGDVTIVNFWASWCGLAPACRIKAGMTCFTPLCCRRKKSPRFCKRR